MVRTSNLWSNGRGFESQLVHCHVSTLGKLFTPMFLSPSNIIWYHSNGNDALQLTRFLLLPEKLILAWWKIMSAAYYQVLWLHHLWADCLDSLDWDNSGSYARNQNIWDISSFTYLPNKTMNICISFLLHTDRPTWVSFQKTFACWQHWYYYYYFY